MKQKLAHIMQRIQAAANRVSRNPDQIRLVAVTKTLPVQRVRDAVDAGLTVFGENYIQEAREKFQALANLPISWHFIGHLQTNKAKYAVRQFDLIHTVDSLRLATELNREAEKHDKIQSILIQVNIAQEASKSGADSGGTIPLIQEISQLAHVRIQGLMTMPPYDDDPEQVRPFFRSLKTLSDQIRNLGIPGVSMTELSMGMSHDFEVAIEEGATLVRIGTAIFGDRS
ncbi:MAG: YggS family pyridoxal phosphate-dependent enzyme [Desulfatirhabdiaceae bacterium]